MSTPRFHCRSSIVSSGRRCWGWPSAALRWRPRWSSRRSGRSNKLSGPSNRWRRRPCRGAAFACDRTRIGPNRTEPCPTNSSAGNRPLRRKSRVGRWEGFFRNLFHRRTWLVEAGEDREQQQDGWGLHGDWWPSVLLSNISMNPTETIRSNHQVTWPLLARTKAVDIPFHHATNQALFADLVCLMCSILRKSSFLLRDIVQWTLCSIISSTSQRDRLADFAFLTIFLRNDAKRILAAMVNPREIPWAICEYTNNWIST